MEKMYTVDSEDETFKILLLGDSGVGKTSFLLQYTESQFNNVFISTIGVEYKMKVFNYRNKLVKFQIWDTAGQERFKAITRNYLRGSHGILLMYDITNDTTFDNIKQWLKQIYKAVEENVCVIVVGNKVDLEDERLVKSSDAESFCETKGYKYYECSAKTAHNVKEAFNDLSNQVCNKFFGRIRSKSQINKSKKKNCCSN